MTQTPSASASHPRWRSIIATFALVGALVASSAVSATASDIGTGPGVISGTATNIDGVPVEGVFVGAQVSFGEGTAFWAYTYTDAAGHFEFTDLALDYTYDITASLFGYQPSSVQHITLTAESPTATADVQILPFAVGVGTISGYVTGDGVPIAGKNVSAYETFSSQNLSTVTDETGFYQFSGLANGQWSVTVWGDPAYQPLYPPSVQLTDGAPSATVDFPFLSWPVGTASISGVVTDSATGEPLANTQVSAFGYDVANNSFTWTDETGAFSFELLPEGTYGLSFFASGYLRATAEVQAIADQSVNADQALVAANASISGHIKDKNGQPVAGIYVDARPADGFSAGATTDENGDYVISDLGAIPYTVTVGGIGTPYTQKDRVVTPVANGDITANFKLRDRKTGTFGGVVFGPGEEWYTEPVCVTLYSSKNKKPVAEVATYGPEYGDGTYSFYDIKPGSYTVEFEDCDADPAKKFDNVFLGGAKKYKDATFVTIAAAQDTYENNHTLTFREPNSTISGHIAKPNGTPIAGLTVHASGEDSSADAVTDANGDYTISGLFNGEYTVSAGGVGTLYVHKQKSVTVDEGGSATANFTLAKR